MKDYKVGIIGFGVVGKGIYRLLKDDVKCVYDPFIQDNDLWLFSKEIGAKNYPSLNVKTDFKNLDMIVICVMTPSKEDGSCDTSIIESTLQWVVSLHDTKKPLVLIKSAVVPSEMKDINDLNLLRLVVSPEYLGESSYFTPAWNYPDPKNMESHTWQIFGGDREDTSLCVDIFKRKMGVDCRFYQTDLMTASLCKYMENSFFATKVTFCNEWFDIAKSYGIDYNELRELWLADPRINRNHTLVFPEKRGYSGKCFPKDVKAIIKDAEKMGIDATLMKAVDKTNETIKGRYEISSII